MNTLKLRPKHHEGEQDDVAVEAMDGWPALMVLACGTLKTYPGDVDY